MPAAVAVPLIAGGIAAGGSILGGAMGSSGAKSAAQIQAAQGDKALAFQQQQWEQQQQNMAPWLQSGQNALSILNAGMPNLEAGFDPTAAGLPSTYGSFQAPDAFQAPAPFQTPAPFSYNTSDLLNDPAYQFAISQGNQQIQRSAAARGAGLGGSTLKALADYNAQTNQQYYNQDYARAQGTYQQNLTNSQGIYQQNLQNAANIYQQNYGNQLAAYGANQNAYQQNYSNAANTYWNNQANTYNRWANLAGAGQTAATQLGQFGSNFATNAGNISMSQGNALAAGQIGSANAWTGALGGATNSLSQSLLLSLLMGGFGGKKTGGAD